MTAVIEDVRIENFRRRSHLEDCLGLMRSNIPGFFAQADLSEFGGWLRETASPYLVCRHRGEAVGCGGYSMDWSTETGYLRWGMVRRDWHGMGLGSRLLRERILRLRQQGARQLSVETSQHSKGFFLRHGFETVEHQPHGYWPGHDRVTMCRSL